VKAERQASIGELAGQLGHDLRNPLAGINTVYTLLKRGAGNLVTLNALIFCALLIWQLRMQTVLSQA
jgi:nitrogen-specific signal transduction histidine kinase